jgi:hypothetical protein
MLIQTTTADSAVMKSNSWKDYLSEPEIELRGLKAEKARRSLYEFVIQGWAILEPATPFVTGIHVEAICQHLHAVTEGRIGNLIINGKRPINPSSQACRAGCILVS